MPFVNTRTGEQSNMSPDWHTNPSPYWDWTYVEPPPVQQTSSAPFPPPPSIPAFQVATGSVRYDPKAIERDQRVAAFIGKFVLFLIWAYLSVGLSGTRATESGWLLKTTGDLAVTGGYIVAAALLIWASKYKFSRWLLGLITAGVVLFLVL